jgi:23S rRNA pseudouridine1911/1915/1917 synthase
MSLDVLYEDNHCLAVNKPAGLASQADASGEECLVDLAKVYLKEKYHKPGAVYLGLLHRLDRPTSGVMLLARTSKAAGRLSEQFRQGTIEKIYWAVVCGELAEEQGEWLDFLEKSAIGNRTRVVGPGGAVGKEARVSYRVLARDRGFSTLELRPGTGRGHQLRVQLAHRGLPIVGDLKYGSRERLAAADGGGRIALHARRLSFRHPTRGEAIVVDAPLPADWPASGQ